MNLIYTLKDLIQGDLYRYEAGTHWKHFLHAYSVYEGFRFSVWLRVCNCVRKRKIAKYMLLPFAKIMYNHYRYKFGYDISYGIDIGPGLLLCHFGGVVVTASKIGKNATISHCCTIGMRIRNGKKYFPVIGDAVYMAPGSKIVGDITIGDNVAIGTNAVVLTSISDNGVAVGVPAKVISDSGSGDYVPNRI